MQHGAGDILHLHDRRFFLAERPRPLADLFDQRRVDAEDEGDGAAGDAGDDVGGAHAEAADDLEWGVLSLRRLGWLHGATVPVPMPPAPTPSLVP